MQDKIKEILCEVKEDSMPMDEMNADTSIINDVGLDSLQMINFILKVEDEFDLEIDFDDFDYSHLDSIELFCKFVSSCNTAV